MFRVASLLALCVFALPAWGQQNFVSRYDVFAGYAYFNSPAIGLPESGVQLQGGVRMRTWYSLGFDYSNARGDLTLKPSYLPNALQQQLGAQLAQLVAAGIIPANYTLNVPTRSETQTFAAGPQFSYRGFKTITLHIRPSLGAMREVAIPNPTDPVAKQIVHGLTPTGRKRDWVGFYGVGGAFDVNLSKHVGLRWQCDYVWDHLFNDILRDGRYTFRMGVGPFFNFGRNIRE